MPSPVVWTKASTNINLQSESNPTHLYRQEVREADEHLTCSECGVTASIDGGLPVDLFKMVWPDPFYGEQVKALCLGCLGTHRMRGGKARRV